MRNLHTSPLRETKSELAPPVPRHVIAHTGDRTSFRQGTTFSLDERRPYRGWAASVDHVCSAEECIIEIIGPENMALRDREEKKVVEEPVRIVHRRHELLLRQYLAMNSLAS